jgi:hypothetical protein
MSAQFEEQVLSVLTRHLSRVTAKVILQHGRRVLRDSKVVAADEQQVFLEAVRMSAWFFLTESERANVAEELARLAP